MKSLKRLLRKGLMLIIVGIVWFVVVGGGVVVGVGVVVFV